MNGRELSAFNASKRMKMDLNFRNIILKNCSRLRQKSNDDYINSKKNTESNINNSTQITNYKKIEDNKFLDSNDNISVDMNANLFGKNNDDKKNSKKILKKFFYNLDLNKIGIEHKSGAETERLRKNLNIDDSFNKFRRIRVNQLKNIEIVNNNSKYETNFEKNFWDLSKRKNTLDVKLSDNSIKEINNNSYEKHSIINKKRKNVWKRSNSIRKIMNSLYFNSYATEKEKNDKEKKQILNEKNNNVNKISNLYMEKEKSLNDKRKIITKNKICDSNDYNKDYYMDKIKTNKKLDINHNYNELYKKKKSMLGIILNNSNNIHVYNTKENSRFITEENSKIINENDSKIRKEKMIYHKPDIKIKIKEKLLNRIDIFKKCAGERKLELTKIKNEEIKTEKNNSNEKNEEKFGNCLTPMMNIWPKRKKYFKNKDEYIPKINYSKKNFNNDVNDMSYTDRSIRKNKYLFIEPNNGEKEKKEKDNFICHFFDDIIELCNGINEKTIFQVLIKKINKKYIIDYNEKAFEINQKNINYNFEYCFKYFCIILISFYFLSKDDILYKENSEKIHLLYIQFIYSSLCLIGYDDLKSKNIKRFFIDYSFKKKVSIIQCITSIIKLLFDDKEEYISLNNILKQLLINIRTISLTDIIKKINQSILFCFNQSSNDQNKKYFRQLYNNNQNIRFKIINEENNKKNVKSPSIPYIKTKMSKDFCLVLDLDETISHAMKMNFGYYFFLRPGTIELLTELSEFYEIIIFTSSPKEYADDILDKIDSKGDLISHRLYKSHVIFEKGKSIKHLRLIGRDLNKIIFVDNIKSNAKYNPKNLYLIPSWKDDIYDNEIYKLKDKLKYIYQSGKFKDDITKGLL